MARSYTDLWDRIVSWENLIEAARRAALGKRSHECVMRFDAAIIDELVAIRNELIEGRYRPGPYAEFLIRKPKARKISAAPFRDRVVHHALCRVIMPIFERTLIDTCFANRVGKGTHRAVLLCQRYLRAHAWFLQLDIRKYFPSIDHGILKTMLSRKIRCRRTVELINLIIDSSNEQGAIPFDSPERHGLPIGNLTSQYFANIYLSPLDHFVREKLGIRFYIRYVDDFLLFGDSKELLRSSLELIEQFLRGYRLRVHEERAHVMRSNQGITFLGYRIFPYQIRLARENPIQARRRLAARYRALCAGREEPSGFRASLAAWMGHAKITANPGIIQSVLGKAAASGDSRHGADAGPNSCSPISRGASSRREPP